MVTSQPTEIQAEGKIDVNEAVKEILAEMEAEEQDPLEGMGNAQIAEIYHRMMPEDQRLFRQFKRFHKQYYETHGHDAPSHLLTCGIMQQMFPGRTVGRRVTQGAVQAARTGSPNPATTVPTTTGGTRIPTATSATTIFVKTRQGEDGHSATSGGG